MKSLTKKSVLGSLATGLVIALLAACGGSTPPAATPAAPTATAVAPAEGTTPAVPADATGAVPTAAPAGGAEIALGDLAWDCVFDTVEGWYDGKADAAFGSAISSEAGGKARLKENGSDQWGKAIIVVTNIDFSRRPVFSAVVTSMDPGASWKVLAVSNPWNDADVHEVIASSTQVGTVRGDLAQATGWTGVKKDFNLALVVEGNDKSVVFDSLHINYAK